MEKLVTRGDLNKEVRFIFKAKKGISSDTFQTIVGIEEINDTVIDPNTKKERVVRRTIRHIKGERSIFADEQNKYEDDVKLSRAVTRWRIKNNIIVFPAHAITEIEYFRKSNRNGSNPNRDPDAEILYYEYQPEVQAKKANDAEELKFKAEERAWKMSDRERKIYLLVVSNSEAASKFAANADPESLKHEVVRLAKQNPKAFLEGVMSPANKNKANILLAEELGIIRVTQNRSQILWADTGGLIIESTVGKNAVDRLAEVAAADPRFGEVLELIKTKIDAIENPVKGEAIDLMKGFKDAGEVIVDFHKIYNDLKAKEAIKHEGLAVVVGERKFSNVTAFKTAMSSDPEFLKQMQELL